MLLVDQSNSSPTIQSVDRRSECFKPSDTATLPQFPNTGTEEIQDSEILSDLAFFLSDSYLNDNTQFSSVGLHDTSDDNDDDLSDPEIPYKLSQWEFDANDSFACDTRSVVARHSDTADLVKKTSRVRFMMDPCNEDAVMCHIYDNTTNLTSKELTRRWYRPIDIKRFRRMSHMEVLCARTSSTYVEQFRFLFASCDSSTTLQSLSHAFASTVASSPYRGYECMVFSDLFRTVRKAMVQEILQVQRDFRSTHHCSSEILAVILASRSKQLSKQSRRVAYVIGEGDADIAHTIYDSNDELGCDMILSSASMVELEKLEI